MTHRALLLILLVAATVAYSADEDGFVSMFNGTDLAGWDGKPGGWRVEDGAITGESTPEKPLDAAHYLFWTGGTPKDFVMRFEYKLVGGNSGVQIRSKRVGDYDAWGYQADMEMGPDWTGCLFQHDREAVVLRGKKATIAPDGTRKESTFADTAELLKIVKPEEWNTYEVSAVGSTVTLSINGQLMCEVDDQDAAMACHEGHIGLQMHPGPPMKVQFRNLRIKILDPPAATAADTTTKPK